MLLEVKDLQVSLKKDKRFVKILDGVTFSLGKKETLGIVGESGCGKSMTALSIMGILASKAQRTGEIRFEGEPISTYSSKQMQKVRGNEISMIFQEPLTSLNPLHTIGKQIGEALLLHTSLSAKERRQRAIDLLNAVGIPRSSEIVDEYPHQLSGGMRQRVMIAIAMACQPKVLICDEPTTALDVTVQAQILDLMKGLKEEHDMAMLMITHDLGVVAEVCDRVVVMYAGKIVEEAEVEELFADAKHPYTKGLLESIPVMEERKDRLGSIPGTVPAPTDMPVGCRFADRCSEVMSICRTTAPPEVQVGEGHLCRCWLYQETRGEEAGP